MDTVKNWFALKVKTGSERAVKDFIESKKDLFNVNDVLDEVYIANKEKVTIVNGKKKITKINEYKGYVFIKADIADQRIIDLLKITPDLFGFKNSKSKQTLLSKIPLSKNDVDRLFKGTTVNKQKSFSVGDIVKIINGPFMNFSGKIISLNEKAQSLELAISVFGREMKVNVPFADVDVF